MDLFQNIFHLPASCVFSTAMPKNAFEKNNTLSAAEKRLISTPFLPLHATFRGSLVQSRSFIPPKQGKEMDYDDILFFNLKLKPEHLEKYSDKLVQLYQKYIPKPCVILLYDDVRFRVNTALKKYNEVDKNKRVITEQLTTPMIPITTDDTNQKQFLKNLNFNEVDKQNLKIVHQYYARGIINYNIVAATGKTTDVAGVAENAQHLREIIQTEKELDALRNRIRSSKKLDEKIAFKLQLKQEKKKLEKLKERL